MAVLSSSCRETASKTRLKKPKGVNDRALFPPLDFFGKTFLTWTFYKTFFMAFLNSETLFVEKSTETPITKKVKNQV
jgi:hypothetical protein